MAFLEPRSCRSPCVSRGTVRRSSLPCLRLSARVPKVTVGISMDNGIAIGPHTTRLAAEYWRTRRFRERAVALSLAEANASPGGGSQCSRICLDALGDLRTDTYAEAAMTATNSDR